MVSTGNALDEGTNFRQFVECVVTEYEAND